MQLCMAQYRLVHSLTSAVTNSTGGDQSLKKIGACSRKRTHILWLPEFYLRMRRGLGSGRQGTHDRYSHQVAYQAACENPKIQGRGSQASRKLIRRKMITGPERRACRTLAPGPQLAQDITCRGFIPRERTGPPPNLLQNLPQV